MDGLIRVFISSKQGELDQERAIIADKARQIGLEPVMAEDWNPERRDAAQVFESRIRQCPLYVGLFYRTMSLPTKREYEVAAGHPFREILICKRSLPTSQMDPRLVEFLSELAGSHTLVQYSDPSDLLSVVNQHLAAAVARIVETLMTLQRTSGSGQSFGSLPRRQSILREYLLSLGFENGVLEAKRVESVVGKLNGIIDVLTERHPSTEEQRYLELKNSTDEVGTEKISVPQPQLRHLHARLPERVRVGDRIPLQVRVALSPAQIRSTPLRAFSIPPEGADVKLVLDCPGFLLHSASMTTVHVAPTADSDWVLFELEALHEGVYTLEISAFNGGAFLGTLSLQLTVDSVAIRAHSVDHLTMLPLRTPQEGEATLVIHYDPLSTVYRYQFRNTTLGETDELRSGPLRRRQEEAIADLTTLLNEQARDLTGYSAEETRRWLQGKGIELWNELIPKELENLFWQQRENIKSMTILSAGDPMPWEVMYPTNSAGDDAGFLAEQFPIVRWIFGPAPTPLLQCSKPFFVVPDDAPLTAEDELAALRGIMGEGQKINELTALLRLLDAAEFDVLHFACHNIFWADSPTNSSIQIGSKRFVPTFLSKYKGQFYRRSPLVFLNACRSGGMAANYTWLAGWAKSFLAAGAGAFIGSLWEVRDSSASHFAEEFYRALLSGTPLGDAMKQARTAIQNEPGDPTWLAYTLYGNPAAILSKETPKLG